jgi:NADH dehydrogenase [ubiquinone] 1 alpha subcomplex assembly factor 7
MSQQQTTPLGKDLAALIAQEGPLSIERYMALCLSDPRYGYYMTRDPLGARGDFITAPEISQVFGELLGLWCGECFRLMGSPSSFLLVELGPGRGTLMADALRVLKIVPSFLDTVEIHLVETSPVLRAQQQANLKAFQDKITWHVSIDTLPAKPALILANEFFDALPIRQFQKEAQGWHERLIGLDEDGTLVLGLAAEPTPSLAALQAEDGSVYEEARIGATIMRSLARHLRSYGGAMLAIDYGHVRSGFGDTWQAMTHHAFADPLARPGEADLTSHVDFQKLGESAAAGGAMVAPAITQRDLLLRLGLEPRLQQLTRGNPDRSYDVTKACLRLIDHTSPQAMGQLFKALALSHPDFGPIPAFDPPSS